MYDTLTVVEKIYTPIHLHDHHSNINMVEVVTKFEQYVERAIELGLPTIVCTNHGVLTGWYNRKKLLESKNMKYVHAVEAYVTWDLENKARDNFHLSLFAKNFEGFKELNKLVSNSFNRSDNHFYYNPRIAWKDIKNTSDNILVSTACLGSFIWKLKDDDEKYAEILQWIDNNKHRVFLEVQPHRHLEQAKLNRHLINLARNNGWRIIAGGDVHALNKEHDEARKILQKSKRVEFADEDSFDLTLKSYDEIFEQFQAQGVLTDGEIAEALNNTNVLLDMVEPFKLDYSKKYPKLHANPDRVLQEKIAEGIKFRGVDKIPHHEKLIYAQRIQHELDTYRANEAENYLLLEDMVKTYARENDIAYGYGRGSVSGSIIAYLMQITEMNSIKRGLNFERFMNKERISLADVDSDYDPQKRYMIQDFLMNHPELYCAPIMTSNTIAMKGAIRDIGRGLGMPLNEVDDIAKGVEEAEHYYRDRYPELFKYVDIVLGTITSIGQHACGICVSPIPLDENMGLITTKDSPYPLTMLNMKEIDDQNYVKLDILGLDTTSVISEACRLAGIDFVTPQNLDSEDEKVWNSILDSNVGIFQWESDFSHQIYKDLFSKETIAKIKAQNPNFSYIDLFSLGNAILRPSGASYRESVCQGEFYDNGHPALNEFLASTLGRLVYQEQLMEFLVKFCGYTMGQADLVRRGIGKKIKAIIDTEVPKIEAKFIETMTRDYELSYEEAERIAKPFMQVFLDSADYGFSVNHSDAYSWMGYAMAWLRYYYPIEFLTASLNVNIGKEDKTNKLVEYAKDKGIKLDGIKFRYSRDGYMFNKETNSIYQGVEPIKFLNAQVAEGLYELRNKEYKCFTDLLVDIKDGMVLHCDSTSQVMDIKDLLKIYEPKELQQMVKAEEIVTVGSNEVQINSRQMAILISLNYFSEFGQNKKLLQLFEFFEKTYKKTLTLKSKAERYAKVLQREQELENEKLSLVEQYERELEFLGHIESKDESMPPNIMFITEVTKTKTYIRAKAQQFHTGESREFKIGTRTYAYVPFEEKDVIQIINAQVKPKKKKINGVWADSNEKELWLKDVKFVRKGGNE
ncbi:PHP domain-containing protein [Bacillus sp. ISTL8]|uniref:PHP domain-containing protein n=1 Tax=Bacillus sp. ISTL8 TaxID=2596896 RepID=UPI0014568016|nr:PHP domain-containing protein [Bacillus sp. ISTL8]